jgi:tripartite-type tricarboxylate transporter receptor subunit TctC
MKYVAYRSIGAAIPDLMENRIQVAFMPLSIGMPQVRAGKLRLLAVTSAERAPFFPQTPSLVDLGYSDLSNMGLIGLYAPKSLAGPLLDRVSTDVRAVLAEPAIHKRLLELAFLPRGSTPAELAGQLAQSRSRWAEIARKYALTANQPN